jgi:hypothetical protein
MSCADEKRVAKRPSMAATQTLAALRYKMLRFRRKG